MTTDTHTLADNYADSIARGIESMHDAGSTFGWTRTDTGEWSSDAPDGWEDGDAPEWEEATGIDYLQDVLDIQYVVNGDRTYRAARVCVSLGGPNAWIDTLANTVQVTWGFDYSERALPARFCRGLDDALADLWEMGA